MQQLKKGKTLFFDFEKKRKIRTFEHWFPVYRLAM